MRWVPARLFMKSAQFRPQFSKLHVKPYSWKTMPEEIIGVMPSSISVPLLLANIMRSQYRGSEVSEDTMP